MTSISNETSAYLDYARKMDDYEQELKNKSKKQADSEESAAARRERDQETALAKLDRSWQRTTEKSKEGSNQILSEERMRNQESERALQKQIYDRYGRNRSAELDSQQHQIEEARASIEVEKAANEARNAQADKDHQDRISELEEKNQHEMEVAINNAKSSGESGDEYHAHQMILERTREEAAQRKIDMQAARLRQDTRDQDKKTAATAEATKFAADSRIKAVEAAEAARGERLQEHYAKVSQDTAEHLRASHADESAVYRAELKNMSDAQRTYLADRQNGRADAQREFDQDVRADRQFIVGTYEREIGNYKKALKDQDSYFSRVNDQNVHDKDFYWANEVAKENRERHQETSQLEKTFEANRKQLEANSRRDRNQSDKAQLTMANTIQEGAVDALRKQASSYHSTLARQLREKDSTIDRLKSEIQTRATSPDVQLVAPAAEERMRNTITGDFNARAVANEARDLNARDHLAESYTTNLQSVLGEQHALRDESERTHHIERQRERGELLTAIADSEFQKNASLQEKDAMNQRFVERIEKGHQRTSEQQRQDYEELLARTRQEAQISQQAQRQQFEFQARMTQRAFAQKQNEIIKEYEKRLIDQKQDTTLALQAMREEGEKKVREVETRARHDADAVNRANEQRIAQMEMQSSERERAIAHNYEDEIEKAKRSNALHSRQKA